MHFKKSLYMNPYEPSQVTELAPSRMPMPGIGRIILREWLGRLWIYNGVLAIVWLSFWASGKVEWQHYWGIALIYLNAAFCLGPLIEVVVTWKRQRRIDWGPALFAMSLAIGVFCLLILVILSNASFG